MSGLLWFVNIYFIIAYTGFISSLLSASMLSFLLSSTFLTRSIGTSFTIITAATVFCGDENSGLTGRTKQLAVVIITNSVRSTHGDGRHWRTLHPTVYTHGL